MFKGAFKRSSSSFELKILAGEIVCQSLFWDQSFTVPCPCGDQVGTGARSVKALLPPASQ